MMTTDQAVQSSYMRPDAFKRLSPYELKSLSDKINSELKEIKRICPQSQKKDRTVYQYRYTLKIINQFIH